MPSLHKKPCEVRTPPNDLLVCNHIIEYNKSRNTRVLKMQNENGRTKQRKRENPAKEGKDANVIASLNGEQLAFLYAKLHKKGISVNTHDVADERYHCHEAVHKDKKGLYAKTIILGKKRMREEDSFFSQRGFVGAQIVLVHGGFLPPTADAQPSHLCDNPCCLRLGHLVWESVLANAQRKGCIGDVQCRCCPDRHFIRICAHEPQCIKIKK